MVVTTARHVLVSGLSLLTGGRKTAMIARKSLTATILAALAILACDVATPSLVDVPVPVVADAPVGPLEIPSADWVPEPPFGWGVFDYEFFPDSLESTFDSLSTVYDSVTWRYRDYPRFTAYGEGWQIPVWTNSYPSYSVRDRVEYYMEKIGRLGAGILNQVPEYGIALLDRVPGLFSLCDPLGATVYDSDADVKSPLVIILVYDQFEYESFLCGDARETSVGGVMLHEFGHVIADPVLSCTARWRRAVTGDSERFPSQYSQYLSQGYDPRTGTEDEDDIGYWPCMDYPAVGALEADTIPSGEDVAESFAMWWLTRCKAGEEPVMDELVASWFPNRLFALDSAMDVSAVADSTYVPRCQFPVRMPTIAAGDWIDDPIIGLPPRRNTIPNGIIVR